MDKTSGCEKVGKADCGKGCEMPNAGDSASCGTVLAAWRSKPWQMIGIGYYFAWTLLAVYNVRGLALSSVPFYPMLAVRVSLSAFLVVGLVLVMVFPKKLDVLNSGKWVLAFAAGSSAMGTMLLVFALSYIDSFALVVLATALIGFGNAILLLSWGEFFQRLTFVRLAGHVLFSCLFAAAVGMGACFLAVSFKLVLTVILPVASAVTLIFCLPGQSERQEISGVWQSGLPKILLSCFIAAVILGSIRSFPSFNEALSGRSEVVFAVMVGIFFGGVIAFLVGARKAPVLFLYRFCMPLMVVGYGLFIVDDPTARTFAVALILSGRILFEILILLVYPFVSVRTKMSRLYLFGLSVIALHTGTFVGLLIGNWVSSSSSAISFDLDMFCLMAIVSLMILFFFLFRELDILQITRTRGAKAVSVPGSEKGRIAEISKAYHLSAREAQVFTLLANGRTLPYIESELYISHSTTRTHVKHIYEKLGVADRQQLIDFIETFESGAFEK